MLLNLIYSFIDKHFPNIEGALLYGSYIKNKKKANDIDLLLISKRFLYSTKESFLYKSKKFNVIKLNNDEIYSVLSKHYLQGDFYKHIFLDSIVLMDNDRQIQHIKDFIKNSYPQKEKEILAINLNEIIFKISENISALKSPTSEIEYFTISSKIISYLIDWFLFTANIRFMKSEKFKSRYFNTYYPIENSRILKLIAISTTKKTKFFIQDLNIFCKDYNIPIDKKYSNDYILDDYSQSQVVLYINNLFSFNEIKEIIKQIKNFSNRVDFYIYQVDDNNHENKGCYIVFDNSKSNITSEKERWIEFIKKMFHEKQYYFPYNNIFCHSEIKFLGKQNELVIQKLFTNLINFIYANSISKEILLFSIFHEYFIKSNTKMDVYYQYYLGRLSATSHSSNYLTDKNEQIENEFIQSNHENIENFIKVFKNIKRIHFDFDFQIVNDVPIGFHIQVIDRLISPIFKKDFEKLFFIYCLKQIIDVKFS